MVNIITCHISALSVAVTILGTDHKRSDARGGEFPAFTNSFTTTADGCFIIIFIIIIIIIIIIILFI